MQKCALLTTFLLVFAVDSSGRDRFPARAGQKDIWNWTPGERVEARRDPLQREQRLVAHQQAGQTTPIGDVIDGARTPELFFPGELFEYLVRSSFVTLPQVYPRVVAQRATDLFRETAEWERFREITASYARVLADERAAVGRADAVAVSELQERKCVAAAEAFRRARDEFGRERFDRMLYEVVPVSITVTYSADTNFDVVIAKALEREARCQ